MKRAVAAARVAGARARRFAAGHIPELCLLGLGALLRLLMLSNYDLTMGYDFPDHALVVEWYRDRLRLPLPLPDLQFSREAYHPPLYYVLAGAVLRWFGNYRAVQAMGIGFGIARLALVWYGLERYLPSRLARIAGLALATVLPTAIHLDGMIYGEPLNNLLTVAALLIILRLFAAEDGRGRWWKAALLGLLLGLQLLTKVSGLLVILTAGAAAILDLALRPRGGWRTQLRRLAPMALCAGVLLAVAGPYYAHNYRRHHKVFLAGWDGPDQWQKNQPGPHHLPYLQRRPLAFFVGWNNDIFSSPYWSTGVFPNHRFWPVLIASTFVDYYNYGFSPPPDDQPTVAINGRPVRVAALLPARLSVIGGTAIAALVMVAWLAATWWACRARAAAALGILTLPALAVAGQMHFATLYPFDWEGLVKGAYLQFAAAPLMALFGLAIAWLWTRPRLRPLALVGLAAVAMVASYGLYSRFA